MRAEGHILAGLGWRSRVSCGERRPPRRPTAGRPGLPSLPSDRSALSPRTPVARHDSPEPWRPSTTRSTRGPSQNVPPAAGTRFRLRCDEGAAGGHALARQSPPSLERTDAPCHGARTADLPPQQLLWFGHQHLRLARRHWSVPFSSRPRLSRQTASRSTTTTAANALSDDHPSPTPPPAGVCLVAFEVLRQIPRRRGRPSQVGSRSGWWRPLDDPAGAPFTSTGASTGGGHAKESWEFGYVVSPAPATTRLVRAASLNPTLA
jgi:hypothetical protein